VNIAVLERLLLLSFDDAASADVRAVAVEAVNSLERRLSDGASRDGATIWRAHYSLAQQMIRQAREDPASLEKLVPVTVPPGSPIGSFD
jgi:hypothetical protein